MANQILQALMVVLSEEDARAVIDHRKITIKKPLTLRAAQNLAKQFALVGDKTAAVDLMIDRAWRGFKAEWVPQPRSASMNLGPNMERVQKLNQPTYNHPAHERLLN